MQKLLLIPVVLLIATLAFTACDGSGSDDESALLVESLSKTDGSEDGFEFPPHGRHGFLRHLKEELEVTDEQAEQIKAVVKEHMQSVREEYKGKWLDMTKEERKEIRMAGRTEVEAKIKEVLTDEQWAKLEEIKANGPDPEEMRERMEAKFEEIKEKLNLTAEQEEQVHELFEKKFEERMELSWEERKDSRKESREQMKEEMSEILTDEQMEILEKWRKERREEMKEHFKNRKHGRRNRN